VDQDAVNDEIEVDGIRYVRAYPVAGGRCEHCGRQEPIWTPRAILDAIIGHHERHGTLPTSETWKNRSGRDHPSLKTVQEVFGKWNAAVKAAGLIPRRVGGQTYWTREKIIAAMCAWPATHDGRAPRQREWANASPNNPPWPVVRRMFGTWNNALEASGFFPRTSYGQIKRNRDVASAEKHNETIDAAPVVAAVNDYLRRSETTKTAFALSLGMDENQLGRMLNHSRRISLTSADRLALEIGRPDLLSQFPLDEVA
jgi:hypothetical protein